jgi:hypothetical protein
MNELCEFQVLDNSSISTLSNPIHDLLPLFPNEVRARRRAPTRQTIEDSVNTVLQSAQTGNEFLGFAPSSAVPHAIRMNWGLLSDPKLSKQFRSRLLTLAGATDGWRGEGSRAMSPSALTTLLTFLRSSLGHAVEPEIALTQEGGVLAQWFKSPKEYLDLTFRPDNSVYFGLFDRGTVYEGVDNSSRVLQFVRTISPAAMRWGK